MFTKQLDSLALCPVVGPTTVINIGPCRMFSTNSDAMLITLKQVISQGRYLYLERDIFRKGMWVTVSNALKTPFVSLCLLVFTLQHCKIMFVTCPGAARKVHFDYSYMALTF